MSNYGNLDLSGAAIGSYYFSKILGKGGFAPVYLADQKGPGFEKRSVAIKILVDVREDRTSFQETFHLFRNETDPLLKLSSLQPILRIYTCEMHEVFVDENGQIATVGHKPPHDPSVTKVITLLMIVMEYADGGTLADTYRQEAIVDTGDFSFLNHFADVCTGLAAVHEEGIIHRDIKPQNLFWFRNERRVKLGDFGIAKCADEAHFASQYLMGSLPYMSPESFDLAALASPSRDIYALGCTLYEVLTGEVAFQIKPEGTTNETYERAKAIHVSQPRPDAITRSPQYVSLELNELLKKMMSVDPEERPTLQQAAAVFQGDKDRRTVSVDTQIRKAETSDLPREPISLLHYNINPDFRMRALKENAFFLFITTPVRTEHRLKEIFAHLRTYFHDTFSIYETFGRYDFIVRVWSGADAKRVIECARRIRDRVLDDQKALRIMQCEDVEYLGRSKQDCDHVDTVQALIKITEAQHKGPETKDAVKWLVRNGIYTRKILPTHSLRGIKCFCLVRSVSQGLDADSVGSAVEREAKGALLVKLLQKLSPKELQSSAVSVYRRAPTHFPDLEDAWAEFVIKYVVRSYEDAAEIPTKILGGLGSKSAYSFHTTTLLATNRYFIESDNLLLTRD